ncbi:hypothetical protein KAM448_41240 [Aeromonas caviae]|uniref:Uncharacterized protein n=1 Tax=Aeromonas caviae TaxID=648 RepID=A0ABD0B8J4_AERCA|nr:hypothetical protein KAM330_48160 [Aeromonas hydrophila]BCR31418.1 hypothetical protein KAM376_44240 [Aeromonas caviae]GJA71917.1 hypothetical protein KAM353_15640 [Aeromonas caviae]GJA81613.1 hypothetical protein KAM355_21730 [Aeromonas caviae]GJB00106.1 hypothetical protein KAM359_35130 [Aeromonas caviae]
MAMSPVLLLQQVLLVAGECIEGHRRTHQERPGSVAMSPVLLLQLGISGRRR